MSEKIKARTKLISALMAGGFLVAVAMMLLGVGLAPVRAQVTQPCDFMTGGGWIVHFGAQANFGVGGGCKQGSPTWGHLEYMDHGTSLKVHGTSITAYIFINQGAVDPKTHQPTGTREICGTATTNLYGDLDFAVQASDQGEPGVNDQFDIRLTDNTGTIVSYDTTVECPQHYLGSFAPCAPGSGGGGNIQLHKPNPSNTGNFGGSCPAAFGTTF